MSSESLIGNDGNSLVAIVFRDSRRIVKTSFLMYLANTVLAPVAGFGLVLILSPIFRVAYDLFTQILFEAYAAVITVYAALVFHRMRSRPSPKLGAHCLALGILGFGAGTILFGYAAIRFLSVGHWLRQLRRDGARCNLDNSALVVFGDGNLACRTCSRIVRVGLDVPRRWRKIGFSVFAVGRLAPRSSHNISQHLVRWYPRIYCKPHFREWPDFPTLSV